MSRTLNTFVLDRSGSMSIIKPATIEAYNTYVKSLQEDMVANGGDPIDFTLIEFETNHIDKMHFEKPIAEIPMMTDASYKPGGGTPLIDAVMTTIIALEAAIAAKVDKPKVIVCIQTDGEENASREYPAGSGGWETLKAKIAAKTAEGWQFNFMGAGIDAYQQAGRMGLTRGQTISYNHADMEQTKTAFLGSAMNAGAFRRGEATSTMYSTLQKMDAGDAYDAAVPLATSLTIGIQAKTTLNLGKPEETKRKDGLDLTK